MEVLANEENFNEVAYLRAQPDIRDAIANGYFPDGLTHFRNYGQQEGRKLRSPLELPPVRQRKLERLTPLLRRDLPLRGDGKPNFLSMVSAGEFDIEDTENVGVNPYEPLITQMISEKKDGLLLDIGAGKRPTYYSNVVNYDIVDYDTTDVIGVGEILPFVTESFDGVISVAVLEHVKDPFRCAAEIARVQKPGGKLICAVPFLQPLHAFPHHYYNMTHQGLRNLFEPYLTIERQMVTDALHPIWGLSWILRNWLSALPAPVRDRFATMTVADLARETESLIYQDFVKQLPEAARFELASGTLLIARK